MVDHYEASFNQHGDGVGDELVLLENQCESILW